jgi:hypothetical protein
MRQLLLPFYDPFFPAPERAVLTLLHAALSVTEHAMRDAHPLVGTAVGEPPRDQAEKVLFYAARLIVGRCAELRQLIDAYDSLLDRLRPPNDDDDDDISF